MIIAVNNRSEEKLFLEHYRALAGFVMSEEALGEDTELSISLVTPLEIQGLNKTYRFVDAPTDVLSFENEGELLGDILICPAVAREHAENFASCFSDEMELMLTHGILHLCGYDHEDDDEAAAMEARENELLSAWRTR